MLLSVPQFRRNDRAAAIVCLRADVSVSRRIAEYLLSAPIPDARRQRTQISQFWSGAGARLKLHRRHKALDESGRRSAHHGSSTSTAAALRVVTCGGGGGDPARTGATPTPTLAGCR